MNKLHLTQLGQYKKIIGKKLYCRWTPKRIMGVYRKRIPKIEKREFILLRCKNKSTIGLR